MLSFFGSTDLDVSDEMVNVLSAAFTSSKFKSLISITLFSFFSFFCIFLTAGFDLGSVDVGGGESASSMPLEIFRLGDRYDTKTQSLSSAIGLDGTDKRTGKFGFGVKTPLAQLLSIKSIVAQLCVLKKKISYYNYKYS